MPFLGRGNLFFMGDFFFLFFLLKWLHVFLSFLSFKMNYKQYIRSNEWLSIRIDILTNRKKCERCGSKHKLQVHHLSYKRLGKEEPEDLEVLCAKCHLKEHNLIKFKKNKVKKHLTLEQKVAKKKKKALEKKKRKHKLYKKLGLK